MAHRHLDRIEELLDHILTDAEQGELPESAQQAYEAYLRVSGMDAERFESFSISQLAQYQGAIGEMHDALLQTQAAFGDTEEVVVGSGVHRTLSDRLRGTAKATIRLLAFAENVSEQTLNEARSVLQAMALAECAPR